MEKGDSDTFPPGRSELMHPVTTADVSVQKDYFAPTLTLPAFKKAKQSKSKEVMGAQLISEKRKHFPQVAYSYMRVHGRGLSHEG